MDKFNPNEFLNGEITENNCNHEVVFKNYFDEGKTGFFHYYCPICGANIKEPINSNFIDDRCLFLTNILKTNDVHYMKGFITSLAYCNKNRKNFDLKKYFAKHKEEIQKELDKSKKMIKKEQEYKNKKLVKTYEK